MISGEMRQKTDLLQRDDFQLTYAAYRIAKMLDDARAQRKHPDQIRVEAPPFDDWDDVVETYTDHTHRRQVKKQATAFKKAAFGSLLVRAGSLPGQDRATLVLSDLVNVEELGEIRIYRELQRRAAVARSDADWKVLADEIRENEKPWLDFVVTLLGDDATVLDALQLVRRMAIEVIDAAELRDRAIRALRSICVEPDNASALFHVLHSLVHEEPSAVKGWNAARARKELHAKAPSISFRAPVSSAPWFRKPLVIESPTDEMERISYRTRTPALIGRGAELASLRAFLDAERPFSWWAVTGESGTGKSRLVFELALASPDWDVGWVRMDEFDDQIALTRPTLFVVDYLGASEDLRAKDLARLLRASESASKSSGIPSRVLVIERDATSLQRAIRRVTGGGIDAIQASHDEPMVLVNLAGTEAQELRDVLSRPDSNADANPLDVLLDAQEGRSEEAIRDLLHREVQRWQLGDDERRCLQVLTLATTTGGLPPSDKTPGDVRAWVMTRFAQAIHDTNRVRDNGSIDPIKHDRIGELLVLDTLDAPGSYAADALTVRDLARLASSVDPEAWQAFLQRASADYPMHPRWAEAATLADSEQLAIGLAFVCAGLVAENPTRARSLLMTLEHRVSESAQLRRAAELTAIICLLGVAPGVDSVFEYDEQVQKLALRVEGPPLAPGEAHPLQPAAEWALLQPDQDALPLSPTITVYARQALVRALNDTDAERVLALVDGAMRLLKDTAIRSPAAQHPTAWMIQALSVGSYTFKVQALTLDEIVPRIETLEQLLAPINDTRLAQLIGEAHAGVVLLASIPPFDRDVVQTHRRRVLELHEQFPDQLDHALARTAINGARRLIPPNVDQTADDVQSDLRDALSAITRAAHRAQERNDEELLRLASQAIGELWAQNHDLAPDEALASTCWDMLEQLGARDPGNDPARAASTLFGRVTRTGLQQNDGETLAIAIGRIASWREEWDQVSNHALVDLIGRIKIDKSLGQETVLRVVEALRVSLPDFYANDPKQLGLVAGSLFGWAQGTKGTDVGNALRDLFNRLGEDFPDMTPFRDALT